MNEEERRQFHLAISRDIEAGIEGETSLTRLQLEETSGDGRVTELFENGVEREEQLPAPKSVGQGGESVEMAQNLHVAV